MEKLDLYPTLINWPFLIGSCLIGFAIEYEIGAVPFWLLFALMAVSYEMIRVYRILDQLEDEVTLGQIQSYYSKDMARKWIPWRDQARGINSERHTKSSSERV
ncbi:hypothetical protein [Gimesia fumaroli]|uniref:Uncharacterized protein n=1 Tax=Gimesia fumaroli TaxID=2527976 RepID=A0A518ILR1_9PLAN|nr:hypothetical protein [Gimesia fumaroli]QDV54017.1 hypothetical protein Enr17x_61000 [Gimesia fumaroli]